MEFSTEAEKEAYKMGVQVGKRLEVERSYGKPPVQPHLDDMTVQDVIDFIKANFEKDGDIDYVSPPVSSSSELLVLPTDKIWADNLWTSCFWVKGSSEGYYVHVARIGQAYKDLIYVKAWSVSTCEKIVTAVSRFINNEWRN